MSRTAVTNVRDAVAAILPGFLLSALVAAMGSGLQQMEVATTGRAWIEALVLAILVGAGIRTAWTPGPRWKRGISFSAKLPLEIAVVLLGASLSIATIMAAGWTLLVSILGIVAVAILFSFGIGSLFGLSRRLAMLVACGNSICGNSAIAAVAPVIGADGDEIASSIAFTAVLGVLVVLILPLIGSFLKMSGVGYGALAGLTVYAVPQVLAATSPAGAVAMQIGTLVKLTRVLMLGPVCLGLSLVSSKFRDGDAHRDDAVIADPKRPAIHQLVPWFIIGFLAMGVLRTTGLIPNFVLPPLAEAATMLTVISMGALGLGVDVRTVRKAGASVTITVIFSLLALGFASFLLVRELAL